MLLKLLLLCLGLLQLSLAANNFHTRAAVDELVLFTFSEDDCDSALFADEEPEAFLGNLTRDDSTECPASRGVVVPDGSTAEEFIKSDGTDAPIIHQVSEGFSIELWLKLNDTYSDALYRPLIVIGDAEAEEETVSNFCLNAFNVMVLIHDNRIEVQIRTDGDTCIAVISDGTVLLGHNELTHFVLSLGNDDGIRTRMYLDGVDATDRFSYHFGSDMDYSAWGTTYHMHLGTFPNSILEPYVGEFYLASIYSAYLDVDAVVQNFNAFLPNSEPVVFDVTANTDEDTDVNITVTFFDFDEHYSSYNSAWDPATDTTHLFLSSLPPLGELYYYYGGPDGGAMPLTPGLLPLELDLQQPLDFRYRPPENAYGGSRGADVYTSFALYASDAYTNGKPGVVDVHVWSVNDMPTALPSNGTLFGGLPALLTFNGSDIDGSVTAARITSYPSSGLLFAANGDGSCDTDRPITAEEVAAGGVLLEGLQVCYDFVFAAPLVDPGPHLGSDWFSFHAVDDEGGESEGAAVKSVEVYNPLTPGLGTQNEVDEDVAGALSFAGVDLLDRDFGYVISSLPVHGSLYQVDDSAVDSLGPLIDSVPTDVSHAEGRVLYLGQADYFNTLTPATGLEGDADSFEFAVKMGQLTSASATSLVYVLSVNDVPTPLAVNGSLYAGLPVRFTLNGTDIDGSVTAARITSYPSSGLLFAAASDSDEGCDVTTPITEADVADGGVLLPGLQLCYDYTFPTPVLDADTAQLASDSLRFAAVDEEGGESVESAELLLAVWNPLAAAAGTENVVDEDVTGVVQLSGSDVLQRGDFTYVITTLPAHGALYQFNGDGDGPGERLRTVPVDVSDAQGRVMYLGELNYFNTLYKQNWESGEYYHTDQGVAADTFGFALKSGSGELTTVAVVSSVWVSNVNDEPELYIPPVDVQVVFENSTTVEGISISDVDGNTFLYEVTIDCTAGEMSLNAEALNDLDLRAGTGIRDSYVRFQGAPDVVALALDPMVYISSGGARGATCVITLADSPEGPFQIDTACDTEECDGSVGDNFSVLVMEVPKDEDNDLESIPFMAAAGLDVVLLTVLAVRYRRKRNAALRRNTDDGEMLVASALSATGGSLPSATNPMYHGHANGNTNALEMTERGEA